MGVAVSVKGATQVEDGEHVGMREGSGGPRFPLGWRVWPTISPTPANIAPISMGTTPTASAASGHPRNWGARSTRSSPRSAAAPRAGRGSSPRSFRQIHSSANAGPLTIVAYITDAVAIRRILDHLGLSPPEKPPPEVRDVVRVPVDEEGREIGVSPG